MNIIYFLMIFNAYFGLLNAYSHSITTPFRPTVKKAAKPITIIQDGEAIIKKGILWPGCYYNESVSDHAPVLYKRNNLATYNISAPLSHFIIQGKTPFLNHKFHTDDSGNLISTKGGNTGFLRRSEVVLFRSIKIHKGYAAITNAYISRMERLFNVIKNIFNDNPDINYMLLQEVPNITDETISKENIHELLKEFINPLDEQNPLLLTFFNPQASRKLTTKIKDYKEFKSDLTPDVAIISRSKKPLLYQKNFADYDNRFAPFCNNQNKECYIAAHMPSSFTEKELQIRCTDLKNLTQNLIQKGYKKISIAGDFNTSAQRIAKECAEILPIKNFNITIHTTKNAKGSSCKDNKGNITSNNIDIMIKYTSM